MITSARHKPRHAKPRPRRSALRTGIGGGVLGTLALTAFAAPASAHQADPGPSYQGSDTHVPYSRHDSNSSAAPDTSASDSVGSPSQSTRPISGSAAAVVEFVRAQLGKGFVMGATGPGAYDCSGLVQAAYRQAGIDLPRVSQAQSAAGRSVSLSDLQPGDILYWGGRGSASHVAIYVGDGQFIGAQNSRTGVVERSMQWSQPSGAVRVL